MYALLEALRFSILSLLSGASSAADILTFLFSVSLQNCTLYKILQLLLCVIQEKVIKVYIFLIVEVTAVHDSHFFKVK